MLGFEVIDATSQGSRAYLLNLRLPPEGGQHAINRALEERHPAASFTWDDPD